MQFYIEKRHSSSTERWISHDPPPWGTLFVTLTLANHPQHNTICEVSHFTGKLKSGIYPSPKCHPPLLVSIWPLKSDTATNCSQFKPLSMQMSFPETVSDRLYCRLLGFANQVLHHTCQVWHIKTLIKQQDYFTGMPHNKSPLQNEQFYTTHCHKRFEGVCKWLADCRDAHQNCCLSTQCSFHN